MFRYIMKRISYMFITLFIVISVVFFLVRLLPGTPFNEQKTKCRTNRSTSSSIWIR